MRIAGIISSNEEANMIEDIAKTFVTISRLHKLTNGLNINDEGRRV